MQQILFEHVTCYRPRNKTVNESWSLPWGASSLWEGWTGNKWNMLECLVVVIVPRKVG